MEEKRPSGICNHSVLMDNREKVSITGVIDIHSFDDELVLAETEQGILTLKGTDLKMNKLNIDNSELIVEGKIIALIYSDDGGNKKTNMLGKLFK